MALPVVVARNQVQKTNKRTLIDQATSGYPITDYTCPTGKIAVIKGDCICTSTGAAATVDLVAGGISQCEWQFSGGGTDPNVPQELDTGVLFRFEVHLAAGETLQRTQNTGTNANTTINIVIEEFNI